MSTVSTRRTNAHTKPRSALPPLLPKQWLVKHLLRCWLPFEIFRRRCKRLNGLVSARPRLAMKEHTVPKQAFTSSTSQTYFSSINLSQSPGYLTFSAHQYVNTTSQVFFARVCLFFLASSQIIYTKRYGMLKNEPSSTSKTAVIRRTHVSPFLKRVRNA